MFIINEKFELNDEQEVLNYLSRNAEFATEDEFDNYLNDVYEPVEICDVIFYPADILRSDKVAYRCSFLDYEGGRVDDVLSDIGRDILCMYDGEEIDRLGFKIVYKEDDDEDDGEDEEDGDSE